MLEFNREGMLQLSVRDFITKKIKEGYDVLTEKDYLVIKRGTIKQEVRILKDSWNIVLVDYV